MLPTDAGEDLYLGGDDGGGIQSAAQTGLDDGHIAALLLEIEQGSGSEHLELGEALSVRECALDLGRRPAGSGRPVRRTRPRWTGAESTICLSAKLTKCGDT